DASGAKVEEETIAVAQFDHDAGASLVAPGRIGTTTDKRDAHFVQSNGLAAGEIVVPTTDRRRWLVVRRELQAGARPTAVGIDRRVLACLGLRRSWVRSGKANRRRARKCALEQIASA